MRSEKNNDTNSNLASTRRSLLQSVSVAGLLSYSTQVPVRAQSDEAQNTNAAVPTNPEIQTALPPTKQGDELVFKGKLVNLTTNSGISNEKITLMEEDDRWGFSDNQLSEDTTDGTGDFSIRWTAKQGGILSDSYSPTYLQYNYSGNSIRYPADQPYLVQTDPSITPLDYNTTTLSPKIVKKNGERAKFYFYVVENNGFDVLEAIPQKWDELPTISMEMNGINSKSYSMSTTEEQLLTEVLSAYTAIPIPGFNLEVDVDTTELSVGSHEFTFNTKTKGGAMERQQNATIKVVRDTKDGQRDVVYNLINRTINPNWWYGQASNKLLSIIIDDPIKYTKDAVTDTIKSFRSGPGSIIKQTLSFLEQIYNNRLKPSLKANSRVKVGNILFDGANNVNLSTIQGYLSDIPLDIRNNRETEARTKVTNALDDIRTWKTSVKNQYNSSPERDNALATLDAAETALERDKQMLPDSNVPPGAVYSDPNSTPARFDNDNNGKINQGELVDGLQSYSNSDITQGELVDLLRAYSKST